MEEINKMEIVCNPFQKRIDYYWYDKKQGEYIAVDPKESELAKSEYTKTAIQRKASEIIDVINNEYNVGNIGLEINFVGTKEDFDDLCRTIKLDYEKFNITCIKDKRYYNTAKEVMPKIKKKFSEIREILTKYSEEQGKEQLDKYIDTIKPSIALCVMGLYTAGKSSFINSIIGREVLPSGSDPTTGKICKICYAQVYEIEFLDKGRKCKLKFDKEKIYYPADTQSEIIAELQQIRATDEVHNETCHMNRVLQILNKKKDISDIVTVRLPFKKTNFLNEEFDFIIYDTPGSNSEQNAEHFGLLQKAIKEQTNALPIFVTDLETLSANDNKNLYDLIEKAKDSLDIINAIVVVNKADRKGEKELGNFKNKVSELTITKLGLKRFFLMSSILGIASKKENPDDVKEWIDSDVFERYDETKQKYLSGKRKLYDYNVIQKDKISEKNNICSEDRSIILYRNSGLESVEKEITEYAQKFALFQKCSLASRYLQQAIDSCAQNLEFVEEQQKKAWNKAKSSLHDKEIKLKNDLNLKQKEFTEDCNTKFQKLIEQILLEYEIDDHLLLNDMKNRWKDIKEEKKTNGNPEKWAFEQMQKYVDDLYNRLIYRLSENINEKANLFWEERAKKLKQEYCSIIHGSKALTEEQKKILESVIRYKAFIRMTKIEFDLRGTGVIRFKKFLFWEREKEKIDIKLCCNIFKMNFENVTRAKTMDLEKRSGNEFKLWAEKLLKKLHIEMTTFNPELRNLSQQISKFENEIEEKAICKSKLEEGKQFIDNLLGMQGR